MDRSFGSPASTKSRRRRGSPAAAVPAIASTTGWVGRGTSVGHARPSGQLAENHRKARSKVWVVRSALPFKTEFNFRPDENTIVETRASESVCPPRNVVATRRN